VTIDLQRLARYLGSLDVHQVGVHLPSGDARDAVAAACRDAVKAVVAVDAKPEVVITADGVLSDGIVRPMKEEVDAAVPDARIVIVLRLVGDVPLAPTLDAYLEVEMIEGRDVWLDDLVPSD
jgi:acyl-coenzyme A synthetase/AMP-(fatty) acid ligase